MGLLLTVGLLASQGPARSQSWAQRNDVLPLPGFRSFVHVLRVRGYRPFRTVPAERSDNFLNDHGGGIISAIRHHYPELVQCNGIDMNVCTFLLARPGQAVVEVETTGEDPARLVIFSIERLNRDQAEMVFQDGCDRGPTPDTPCPR